MKTSATLLCNALDDASIYIDDIEYFSYMVVVEVEGQPYTDIFLSTDDNLEDEYILRLAHDGKLNWLYKNGEQIKQDFDFELATD